MAARSKAHYQTHRAQYRKQQDNRILAVVALKANRPCVDCGGVFPPYVMDFDHRDPSTKMFQISDGVKSHVAWARVVAEIAKCDLVCACCHRLRTHTDPTTYLYRKQRVANLDFVAALKTTTPCVDCGGSFAACQMDFDHVRGQKSTGIARLMDADRQTLEQEIAKCAVVCANCHRIRTWSVRSVARHQSAPPVHRCGPPSPRWWHTLVGTLSDVEIARRAGIHKSSVGSYRKLVGTPVVPSRYTRKRAA